MCLAGCAATPATDDLTVVTVATPDPLPPEHEPADDEPRDELPEPPKGLAGKLYALQMVHAKGMGAESKPARHRLRAGGTKVKRPLTIQPGKCYTVLAVAKGNVDGLRVAIEVDAPPGLPLPMPHMVVAQSDGTTGDSAVLGGLPNCFKNPLPMAAPMTVTISATSGSGTALLQVFVR